MKKHDKRQQNLFNDEEYIREHTRVVRVPRQEPQKQRAMKEEKKSKGTNAKKGDIPRM